MLDTQDNTPKVTLRALGVGLVAAAAANFLPCWSAYVVHSSRLCFAHLPVAAMLPFVFIVLPLNLALRLMKRRWALASGELCLVFCMTWIAGVLPAAGFIGIFLACLSGPYYFATPENKWAETFLEYLPQWAFPSNEGHVMSWFYEGAPMGEAWPLGAWIVPLLWWGAFFAALGIVCFASVVMLRKQWLEAERLTYPLAQVPIALSETEPGAGLRITRSTMFWIGASVPLFILGWNIVCFFVPAMPVIPIGARHYVRLGRYLPRLNCRVNIFMIGLAYFARLDVLFSVWFFYLVCIVQQGVFNRVGFTIGTSDTFAPTGGAATVWQSYGAFTTMTLVGLWIARDHLRVVLRAAFGGKENDESRHEILSYRQAFWCLVLGLLFLFAWLCRAGMSPWLAAFYLVVLLIAYLGVTKIVVETGVIYAWPTVWPHTALYYTLGTANLATPNMVALGVASMGGIGFSCTFIMAPLAHVVRLVPARDKREAGQIRSAMALALIVGAAVSVATIIYLGYDRGAYNFGVWTFQHGAPSHFNRLAGKIRNPMPVDFKRLLFFGIGALLCGALQLMRFRFHWWPLPPVGLAISSIGLLDALAFSVFLAWAAKRVIVRIGGDRAHKSARPLFLGLTIGYIVGIGVGFIVDLLFFFGQGHMLHVW